MATLSGAFQMSGTVFLVLSAVAGLPAVGRRGAYLAHAAAVGPATPHVTLATSLDAVQLKTRETQTWRMTWQAVWGLSDYARHFT